MAKFILGLVCGVGLTLLTPWGPKDMFAAPKKAATPSMAETPAPPREWMFDKSRGTLNEAPRSTVGGN